MENVYLAYLAYAGIGVISGVLAGLLGIGGGLVTVPSLFFLFSLLQFPQADVMHLAIGTSLAAMIFNTLSSTRAHDRKGAVIWSLVREAAPGLIVGGVLGAVIANLTSGVILEIIFGLFLCGIGALFFFEIQPHFKEQALPANPIFFLIFLAIGSLSIILGLGGGLFSVPTLAAFRISHKKVIGTSSAITCLMTIIGSMSFLILGLKNSEIPDSFGYINIPAFLVIGGVSFFFAPLGVKLAHQLPDQTLKRAFGIVLVLTGISMLV